MNRPGGFAITERGLSLCAFPPGALILDIGCGTGETVAYLRARHGFQATGVDVDPAVQGREHLVQAPAEALPLADESVDGALMECSLSVTVDPDRALAECRRVLRPGGSLLLSDVYARGVPARLCGCLGRVETRAQLLDRLAAGGFTGVHVEDFSSHLRALWGQRVLERGTAALCAELGADRERLKAVDCGYLLIVARKARP